MKRPNRYATPKPTTGHATSIATHVIQLISPPLSSGRYGAALTISRSRGAAKHSLVPGSFLAVLRPEYAGKSGKTPRPVSCGRQSRQASPDGDCRVNPLALRGGAINEHPDKKRPGDFPGLPGRPLRLRSTSPESARFPWPDSRTGPGNNPRALPKARRRPSTPPGAL